MENTNLAPQNKMAVTKVGRLIWKMGLPMIVSMVLQAVYNIVDTAFVINMGEGGVAGNLALTYAFPIQLLIIAIGVGTGVGINALLSKSLGEGNRDKCNRVAGNGIFLGFCIYAVFLIFGLFGAKPFIALQAGGDETV
ncbi:MAG: MATE family efflux transporter, partial [Candidatus Coproplasma sp.]